MKYAIVIPDGAADGPLDDLKGLDPREAAQLATERLMETIHRLEAEL